MLVVVTLALLGVLVWGLNPSQPKFTPAPLHPQLPVCPSLPREFIPTNITDLPESALDALSREQKSRALFRMNMEPCPCGCGVSIASCRVNDPSCKTSTELVEGIIVAVEEEDAGRSRGKKH